MNLDHWFPSVIGRSDHLDWLDPMSKALDDIFNNPSTRLNEEFYYNGQTTYGTRNLTTEPQFSSFVSFIQQQACNFLELQGYDSAKVPWRPFLFANSFKQGSNHPKHLHSQCTISGIYYIKTPPGSSNIIFYPNQPFKDFFDYMFMIKDPNNWYSLAKTEYKPYPGLLLMWPSWLYHEVPPNHSTDPRTSLVFNL